MNGSAEGFADYGVAIDPDRNWLASVMERAQRTINILRGPRANGCDARIDDGDERKRPANRKYSRKPRCEASLGVVGIYQPIERLNNQHPIACRIYRKVLFKILIIIV